MLALMISLFIGYAIFKILKDISYETRKTALTYAIILFITTSIASSFFLTPIKTIKKEIKIETLLKTAKLDSYQSNKALVEALEEAIKQGKTKAIIKITRPKDQKHNYFRSIYPPSTILKLTTRNQLFLK